ncbi:MAG: hypothetical protein U0P45_07070 [Acidimicrobiales bacterium]
MTPPSKPRCPRCGSADTIPIIYGLPSADAWDAQERGEAVLGGCCILPGHATDECRACGRSFTDGADPA